MILAKVPRNYKIETIPKTAGLFYVNQGQAKITNQFISLIHYYNLTSLNDMLDLSQNYYSKSLSYCSLITEHDSSTCKLSLLMIHNQLIDLKDRLDEINNYHKPRTQRSKRGLINGISYPVKWLFGIPDADDATFYQKSIESLINDQKQTHVLMQSQIRVISDTIKNINQTMITLDTVESKLNANVVLFNKYMKDSSKIVNTHTIQIELVHHLLLIKQINELLEQQIDQYLNSMTLARHGIVDYNIIPPQTLLDELQSSSKYELPLEPIWSNLEYFYKMIKPKSLLTDNKLVIIIRIPIVHPETFDIQKIFPLPTQYATNPQVLSFIKNDFDFLIISRTRTRYLLLKSLQNCEEYKVGEFLCTDTTIMQDGLQNTCETALFDLTTQVIPKICQVVTLYANTEIWQSVSSYQWLFILTEPTMCSIVCKESSESILLDKTGILSLNETCKAHSNRYTLQPQVELFNKTFSTTFPAIDITTDDCCIRHNVNQSFLSSTSLQPIKITNIDLSELKYAQHRLTQFDEQLQAQLNQPFFIQNESSILKYFKIIASIIGSFFTLYVIYKFKILQVIFYLLKKCFTRRNQGSADNTMKFINCCFGNNNSVKNQVHPESKFDNVVHYETEKSQLAITAPPTSNPEIVTPNRRITRSQSSQASSTKAKRTIFINKD